MSIMLFIIPNENLLKCIIYFSIIKLNMYYRKLRKSREQRGIIKSPSLIIVGIKYENSMVILGMFINLNF